MSLTQDPNDPKLWKARIYPEGRKKDPKTGKPSNKRDTLYFEGDKAGALAWYQEQLRNAGSKKNIKKLAPTINEAYKDFVVFYKNKVAKTTYDDFLLQYDRHLKDYFGQYRPNMLTTSLIEGFKSKKLEEKYLPGKPDQKPEDDKPGEAEKRRHYKKRSIQKMLNYLKAMLTWMTDPDNNLASPLTIKINNYNAKQTEPDPLQVPSRRQIILLIRACKDIIKGVNRKGKTIYERQDKQYRSLLAVAYYTGLRVSELFGLTARQINLNAGYLYIKGKGNKNRTVPIVTKLRPYIKNLPEKGLVFFNAGTEKEWDNIDKLLIRVCDIVGMETIYPHMFRHAFAVHAIQRGVALRTLQIVMGHSSIKTTERYLHMVPSEIAKDLDSVRRTAPMKLPKNNNKI